MSAAAKGIRALVARLSVALLERRIERLDGCIESEIVLHAQMMLELRTARARAAQRLAALEPAPAGAPGTSGQALRFDVGAVQLDLDVTQEKAP